MIYENRPKSTIALPFIFDDLPNACGDELQDQAETTSHRSAKSVDEIDEPNSERSSVDVEKSSRFELISML